MDWHIYLTVFFSGIMALGVICSAVWFTVQQAIKPIKTEIAFLKQEIEESKTNRGKDEANLSKKLDAILLEMKEIRKEMSDKYVSKLECDLTKRACHATIDELKKRTDGL